MTKTEKIFIENMKNSRGIDFARLGQMVEVCGDIGTIKGMNHSANLDVVFANQQKHGKHKHNCHPEHEICYFGENGEIVKDYRK